MERRELHAHLTALTNECIHCGLCLDACPTYALTGAEPDSPRGRLHLMKALLDGKLEPQAEVFGPFDRCLGCRACETACPSSVRYGHLLESVRAEFVTPARPRLGSSAVWKGMLDHVVAHAPRMRLATAPVRLMARHAPALQRIVARMLPPVLGRSVEMVSPSAPLPLLPEWVRTTAPARGTVAFLTGCAMDALYRSVNHATVRMLARAGYDVWMPRSQGCCGALHAHEGDHARAVAFMRANLRAFERQDLLAIVVNSAGCGAAMKEYGSWIEPTDPDHGAASALASKVRDAAEFLAEVGIPVPDRPLPLKVAYDEPCHLVHGQRIKEAPKALLRQIPGLTLVPLAESDWCCGGAGSYAVLQPENSDRLLERKLGHIREAAPDVIVTGNPSCLMQIGLGLRRHGEPTELLHTMELLDRAYAAQGS